MTLRKKTLLIIGCVFLVLIAALYFTSSRILLSRFTDLEEAHTRQDINRANDTLIDDLYELGRLTNDWAQWDDTYAYMKDHNEDFESTNLELETSWINNRVSLMMFIDNSGQMVFGSGFDLNEEQKTPLPESILEYVKDGSPLLDKKDPESGRKGVILLPQGPMLVASEPILTSDGQGPARGSLIWGRFLDEQQIEHLEQVMHLSISTQRLDAALPADFEEALSSMSDDDTVTVNPLDETTVAGYSVIDDIFGNPALMLRVEDPRDIFQHGESTRQNLIATITVASVVFTLITIFLVEAWVLNPVARLSADVRRIGERGDHGERVKASGSDELSLLARVINGMLAGLQESQLKLKSANEELEARVQERTADLLDKVDALQALAEIDREVIASIKSPSILDLACRRTADVLHVPKTLIFLKGEPEGQGIAASFGIEGSPELEKELTGYVEGDLRIQTELLQKGAYVMDEIPSDNGYLPVLQRTADIHSLAAAPLFAEGHSLGAILAFDTKPRGWTEDQIRILGLIGAQIALALDQTRLFEKEQARREELSSLYDLSRQLADAPPSEQEILDLVTRHAVETVHVTFCRIAVIEEGSLVMRSAYPVRSLGVELLGPCPMEVSGNSICSMVMRNNAPEIIHEDDARLTPDERASLFMGLTNYICLVPMRMGERVTGILMLGESRGDEREPFTSEKISLARSVSDQLVSALQRAELFTQLEHSYMETVLSLASAVEAKDTYTADHAESLAAMSLTIGRELGMDVGQLEDLRFGAILHDVGKIGIPDGILQKPGKLDAEEWEKMRMHPALGEQILLPVPRLANAAKLVRYHHERYDGGGYPDRLSGNEIPLGARIITVVDSYSAIIDKRVYKEGASPEEGVAELRRCSGSQFDPEVVEIFVRMLEGGLFRPEARESPPMMS